MRDPTRNIQTDYQNIRFKWDKELGAPNKYVTLLQKKCNGKLPPRHSVTTLLNEAVREHEIKTVTAQRGEKGVYLKKRSLGEAYGIKFPRRSSIATCTTSAPSTATSTASSPLLVSQTELENFKLAVRLQDEWNREDELISCKPLPSSVVDRNQSDDIYMFVPNEGRVAPSFENKEQLEAATVLVELQALAKTVWLKLFACLYLGVFPLLPCLKFIFTAVLKTHFAVFFATFVHVCMSHLDGSSGRVHFAITRLHIQRQLNPQY